MTQLKDGIEVIPAGAAPAAAYAMLAGNDQKRSAMNIEARPIFIPGEPDDGVYRGKSVRSYDRIVTYVELLVEGFSPSGTLIIQLVVDSAVMSQQYTLAAAATYGRIAVTGNGNGGAGAGLVVLAGKSLEAKLTTRSAATDITVTPEATRRIL